MCVDTRVTAVLLKLTPTRRQRERSFLFGVLKSAQQLVLSRCPQLDIHPVDGFRLELAQPNRSLGGRRDGAQTAIASGATIASGAPSLKRKAL
jgi:hypothetical protein